MRRQRCETQGISDGEATEGWQEAFVLGLGATEQGPPLLEEQVAAGLYNVNRHVE